MANTKKVGTPAKPTVGVEVAGIIWFPEQIKKVKTEEAFIETYKTLKVFQPKGKLNAAQAKEQEKKTAEKLADIYKQLKK